MNLHGIVSGAIGAVNPLVWVSIQISTGSEESAAGDGTRVPTYRPAIRRLAQIQPMSNRDLRQIEGLNLQGTPQSIYIQGSVEGIVRVKNKGGDLITTDDGQVWLVNQALEQWPDWVKVVATLQNETAS